MCSVLVLTLNEVENLPRCLASVAWSDDIVVLDSGSTDGTQEAARQLGARVVERPFDDWAAHQNWAVSSISFRNRWVYYSDADETVPDELRAELLTVSRTAPETVGAYRLRYRNHFMGRCLRHCGIYPVWVTRFFRPERIRWSRVVNPVAEVQGEVGRLGSHFDHYSFSRGFDAWFAKHNRYSTGEAEESLRALRGRQMPLRDVLSRDEGERRRALKRVSLSLPLRPLFRFSYMYLFRLGVLDGGPGLRYCILLSIYEYMISLKMEEAGLRAAGRWR